MTDIVFNTDISADGASVKKIFRVKPWENNLRFDLREYKEDQPTRRGISMPILRFISLMHHEEVIGTALGRVMANDKTLDEKFHIGGNLFVSVKAPYWLVDIRQNFMDSESQIRPTRKGLKLRVQEWNKLTTTFEAVKQAIPETAMLTPCYAADDHQNQMGFLCCSECSPNYATSSLNTVD